MYNPKVKPTPSGFYKVNCSIKSGNEEKGKIVMCELVDDKYCKLIGNRQYDDTWTPGYKTGWYVKLELIESVIFFNLN